MRISKCNYVDENSLTKAGTSVVPRFSCVNAQSPDSQEPNQKINILGDFGKI